MRIALLVIIAAAAVGCAGPEPSAPPTPTPRLTLRTFPGNACRLAALPPRPLTFRIEPEAPSLEQVVAVDARGRPNPVLWAEGFVGGTLDDPVVRDPRGDVVARDSEVFARPGDDRLHGYPVCAGNGAVYILLVGRH